MLAPKPIALALSASVAVSLLAACSASTVSGSSAASAPQTTKSSASSANFAATFAAAKKTGLVYIADYTDSSVHIYPLAGKNQQEIGEIHNLPIPEYLNVDRWGNLFVVEFVAGVVAVFPPGASQPSLTLTVDPTGSFPNAVAISHTGEVAVGQFQTNGINFYHKGASTPFKIVKPPAGFGSAGFCAYDVTGNLYVIGSAASQSSHIGVIVGGGKGSSITDLGVNTGITNAKGIQVDTQGNVAVIGDSGTLNLYKPMSNTLISTAQLLDPPNGGPNPNGGFSLIKNGKKLYVASAVLNAQNEGLGLEYAYPGGGNILNTIAVAIPPSGQGQTSVTGIAVYPPEYP